MQQVIIEKPYEFIPPHRGEWLPSLVQGLRLVDYYLRVAHGIERYECRGVERLRDSMQAGHGIVLAPNHTRPADPIAMGLLAREAETHVYGMASWHLFHESWLAAWGLPIIGAFSVYREGIDRQALNMAIEILEHSERPLILFPEGIVTRGNDRLGPLLDGVSFVARAAAKKKARLDPPGKVVIHPIAIKYYFSGDLEEAVSPVLADIERRFSWEPRIDRPLLDRIHAVAKALLCLQEVDRFGVPGKGTYAERLDRLVNALLVPLEEEYLERSQTDGPLAARVKNLRMSILPPMIRGELDERERARRWRQLADIYRAQQIWSYPPDYLAEPDPSIDRMLETVERFEEDLTDQVTVHGDLQVVLEVGEAMEVSPRRVRGAEVDPLLAELRDRLQGMLDQLAQSSPRWTRQTDPLSVDANLQEAEESLD